MAVPTQYRLSWFPELGKDNREDWFLKLNPLGKVPTVVRGDDVVSDQPQG